MRTCDTDVHCGGTQCLPIQGADFGYCDPDAQPGPNGGNNGNNGDLSNNGNNGGHGNNGDHSNNGDIGNNGPNPNNNPVPEPSCSDNLLNGTESDVDCGGQCGGCGLDQSCLGASDCLSGVCDGGRCGEASGDLIGAGANIVFVADRGLRMPASMAFHPNNPGELWVVNQEDDSLTVFLDVHGSSPRDQQITDSSAHFLAKVSGISFGDSGTFGTCGEARNDYHGRQAPDDFMGPVMWTSDRNAYTNIDSASDVHLDMLHDSPNCMGVASAGGNAFFAFNGLNSVIDWYDFREPHHPGGEDHSDGLKRRYEVDVRRQAGVPSGMVTDRASGLLYVADTGNNRIIAMDTTSGRPSGTIQSWQTEQDMERMTGVSYDIVTTAVSQPSGLALHNDTLYVANHADGTIAAFDLDGTELNRLDTGLGSGTITGLAIGNDTLYFIDRRAQKVMRVEAP